MGGHAGDQGVAQRGGAREGPRVRPGPGIAGADRRGTALIAARPLVVADADGRRGAAAFAAQRAGVHSPEDRPAVRPRPAGAPARRRQPDAGARRRDDGVRRIHRRGRAHDLLALDRRRAAGDGPDPGPRETRRRQAAGRRRGAAEPLPPAAARRRERRTRLQLLSEEHGWCG